MNYVFMLYLCISKMSLRGKGGGGTRALYFCKGGLFTFVKRKFFLMVGVVANLTLSKTIPYPLKTLPSK